MLLCIRTLPFLVALAVAGCASGGARGDRPAPVAFALGGLECGAVAGLG